MSLGSAAVRGAGGAAAAAAGNTLLRGPRWATTRDSLLAGATGFRRQEALPPSRSSSANTPPDMVPAAQGTMCGRSAAAAWTFAVCAGAMEEHARGQRRTKLDDDTESVAVSGGRSCLLYAPRDAGDGLLPRAAAVPVGWPLFVAFILALQAVIYTYDGWYGVVYFGGEVHNPGRDVPRAIFGTVLSVLAIYFLVNAAVVHLVSVREFAGSDFAMGIAARRVLGLAGDNFIRVVVVVGLLSSVNAMEMATSRALYAMSRDALFFPVFARVNAGGIPGPALWLSTAVGLCFAMFSFSSGWQRFSRHFSWRTMLCHLCSLFVLRRRMPEIERPHRAWGYPWTTSICSCGLESVFLVGALASDRENTPLTFARCWPRATRSTAR